MTSDIPITSGIYRITCTVTGKFYIGSSVNLRKRLCEHLRTLRLMTHSNNRLQNAWNKYGEQSFTSEVIELVLPPFLLEREQYWLDKLHPAFNIALSTQAPRQGLKHSQQTLTLISAHNRGKPAHNLGAKHTLEARAKMSAAKRCKPAHNRGKKHTPEAIEKMRISHLGKKPSEQTVRIRSEKLRGKRHTPEAIERMRIARSKRPPFSLQTRARMSAAKMGRKLDPQLYETRMKTYIVTAPDGTEQVVHGLKRFCIEHHLNYSRLVQTAKGKCQHSLGWKARFSEELRNT